MSFFKRIKVRLTLWYVLLMAVVLIVFGTVLYFGMEISLMNETDTSLHALGEQLAESLEYGGDSDPEDRQGFENSEHGDDGSPYFQGGEEGEDLLLNLASQGYAIRLVYGDGESIESAGPYCDVFNSETDVHSGYKTIEASGERWRVYTAGIEAPLSRTNAFLQIGASLDRVDSTLSKLLLFESIAVPLFLILAVAGGLFMASRALKPIGEITRLAESIEAVDLSGRLELDLPDDELGKLADTFNEMLERLEEGFARQRTFVTEAAHELRTPLTVMKGTAEVCLKRDRTAAEYRQSLEELKGEVDHLVRLAENLLALSKPESDSTTLNPEDLDLSESVRSSVEMISPLAESKGIDVVFEMSGPAPCHGDRSKINRMILNILDNAIKYSPRDTGVSVSVTPEGEWLVIAVSDRGPGINGNETDSIFDSFHRLDVAREMNPSGVGLGLSIARWIARAHGGDIKVESQSGRGSTFKITLPRRG